MPPKEIERNTNSNYADRYVLRFNNLRTRFQTDGEKIFPAGSERQQCFFNKLACFENEVVPFVPYVRFEYRRATGKPRRKPERTANDRSAYDEKRRGIVKRRAPTSLRNSFIDFFHSV